MMQTVRTPEDAIDEIFGDLKWFYTFDQFGIRHGIFLAVQKDVVICYFGAEFMQMYFNPTTAKFIFHSSLSDTYENSNAFNILLEKLNAVSALGLLPRHYHPMQGIYGTQLIDDGHVPSFALAQKVYDDND